MAQIENDTVFWIKDIYLLEKGNFKANLKDAESYLLKAYQIASESEDQLIYYRLPRLSTL